MSAIITPCPYCDEDVEFIQEAVYAEPKQEKLGMASGDMAEKAFPATFNHKEAVKIQPCGHAFNKDDFMTAVNECRELKRLIGLMRESGMKKRKEEMKIQEIPTQADRVQRLVCNMERIKEIEQRPRGTPTPKFSPTVKYNINDIEMEVFAE